MTITITSSRYYSRSRNPDFIYNYDKFPKRHRPIDKELR